MINKFLIILITFAFTLHADIASKIQRLSTLQKSDRYKLMNEIKRDLVRLNSTQRSEAIWKLRSAMRGKGKGRHLGLRNGQGKGKHLGNGNCKNPNNTQEHKKQGLQKKDTQPKNQPKNQQNHNKK